MNREGSRSLYAGRPYISRKGWNTRPRKEFFSLVGGLTCSTSSAVSATQDRLGNWLSFRSTSGTVSAGTQPAR